MNDKTGGAAWSDRVDDFIDEQEIECDIFAAEIHVLVKEAVEAARREGEREGLKTLAQAMSKIGFCEQCQTIIEIVKKLPSESEVDDGN